MAVGVSSPAWLTAMGIPDGDGINPLADATVRTGSTGAPTAVWDLAPGLMLNGDHRGSSRTLTISARESNRVSDNQLLWLTGGSPDQKIGPFDDGYILPDHIKHYHDMWERGPGEPGPLQLTRQPR